MSRSPTSGISNAITAVGSQPGYLVRITMADQTVYMTNMDIASEYDSHIWVPTDFVLSGISWTTGVMRPAQLVIGDPDLVWWAMALQLKLQDAPVDIWQCYASALTEAEPLWNGRIGGINKGNMLIECALLLDTNLLHAPRRRVQTLVPAKFLVPAGKAVTIGPDVWRFLRQDSQDRE